MEVKFSYTVINYDIYFIVVLRQSGLHQVQAVILEDGPSVPTVISDLTPNDSYMGHTAPLTSKSGILYIYSTNTGTEYFKHALYSPFFLFKMQLVS